MNSVPRDCGRSRDIKVKGEGLLGRAEARSSFFVHSGPAHSASQHYLITKRVHWLALLEAGPMRWSILTPSFLQAALCHLPPLPPRGRQSPRAVRMGRSEGG